MATVGEHRPASDEDWLVYRVKNCMKSDPSAAKCWLITARTLFPRNFSIQYEAYNLEKNNKTVRDAAKLLEDMFLNFPQEPQMRSEVQALSEALQSEASDEKNQFLREVFAAMPSTMQCHMLLRITDSTTDVLEQCRLLLVVLKRYPNWIPDQGVKLVENLLTTEKHARVQCPVNCYRKYLVCDVLPLVLKSSLPDITQKQLIRWLQKAIEFYVTYVTQQPSQEMMMSPTTPDMMSPTKVKSVSYPGQGLRKMSIPGVPEKECYIVAPWEKLEELVQLVAGHLQWQLTGFFSNTSLESQWQQLYAVHQSAEQADESSTLYKQLLYTGTVFFLRCLYTYASKMDSEQFASSASGSVQQRPLVLMEGFKAADAPKMEHRPKKMKAESSSHPSIVAGKNIVVATEITQNFLTALKCWELLNAADPVQKEFNKLLQHWRAGNWHWLKSFRIDILLYQGQFKEAITQLQNFKSGGLPPSAQLRTDLQLACCYYCLGNYVNACEMILTVVGSLPSGTEPTSVPPSSSGSGRHLQLLPCSDAEILPYCIQLMITCLKGKAFRGISADDLSLGHMIVLLQYDWPRYENLFLEALARIQRLGSFTYSIFFNYVINIDILEEFAYLKTQEGGHINLDILPTSTKVIAQQRTVTRGVNKGVKEDFKASMEKQVARSGENIETVIRQFLTEEKELLQQSLSSSTS